MAKETKMKFKILALSANDKATEWAIKIKSVDGLTEAKSGYKIGIEIDEDYFAEQVADIEREISSAEAKPDLFDDVATTIRSLKDNIKGIAKDKKNFEALLSNTLADFSGRVDVADFSKDTLIIAVPESIVADLINIRHNVNAFVVNLK